MRIFVFLVVGKWRQLNAYLFPPLYSETYGSIFFQFSYLPGCCLDAHLRSVFLSARIVSKKLFFYTAFMVNLCVGVVH